VSDDPVDVVFDLLAEKLTEQRVQACPHGGPHSRADRCSQCLGAPATRIRQAGPELFVDGVPIRDIAPSMDPHIQQPRSQRRNRGRK
jgi:hypothetical protein